MSMNTPIGNIYNTTPINQFLELQQFEIDQYLLAINNIAQGDGARISLQNLINSSVSSDVGNLLEIGQDGKLFIKSGAFSLDNGWLIAPTLSVDWSENIITSTDGQFYFNGVLYTGLSSFTIPNVPTTNGANYLYYNFSNEQFEWSVGYPVVDPTVQIANIAAIVNFENGSRFALNAWSYGGITDKLAAYLDSSIGMILTSGGVISNVAIDNPVMRYPLITQSNIASANFSQDIPAITTQDNYLQVYNSGGTLNFIGGQNEIVPLASGTDNPQYVNKSTGALTNLAENTFMNVWMVALPIASQNTYTTSYIFVTGDTQYSDLATAQAAKIEDDYTISLVATIFERYFAAYRFTLTFNGSSFAIADYAKISTLSGEGAGSGGGGSATGAGMPIGTIFYHTCSASFIPENSLPCNGTEYTQAQFPALYTNWLVSGNLNTCTYEQYESEISSTGECWKWGLNTDTNMFKVPTINDVIVRDSVDTIPTSDALINQTIRYFVVVATGSINQSEMDWSAWASGLQTKANINADNFTTEGKALITNYSMPAYETYTAQEWNTVYQATEDRYVYYGGSAINNQSALLIRTPEGQPCGALYAQDNSWGIACYIAYSNDLIYTLIPKGYYYKAVNASGTTNYPVLGYVKLKGVL